MNISGIFMAIFDLFPVVLFLVGGIYYQRMLYNKMSKGAFALFSAGTIFTFVAGVFKATYKILLESRACDFTILNKCFFPMQTIGFVLAAAGLVAMLSYPQEKHAAYSFIPLPILALPFLSESVKEFDGTMIFVVLMVLGVLVMDASLVYIAIKTKNYFIIIFIAISFVFTLGMGYLSTKPDLSDWIKEIVNTVGQALFMTSAIIFKKKGLEDINSLNLKKSKTE